MIRVFIDGGAGTTGLRIAERLAARPDLTVVTLPEALRKDEAARADALNGADAAFLCLPDDAARQAVSLIRSDKTVVIDTSTAHRVQPGWVYGFPELPGQRERIRGARRIANPGCHATGFIALAAPLVSAGVLPADEPLSCFSLTGYSGGGKSMIAAYEQADRPPLLSAPRIYGLSQAHKHLPEMQKMSGLSQPPVFSPVVAPYYSGMIVCIPLQAAQLRCGRADLTEIYRAAYPGPLVRVTEEKSEAGFLSAAALAGRDDLEIGVFGGAERILLTARFDNLGKGASGAAIQNMNIALGLPETAGLETEAAS